MPGMVKARKDPETPLAFTPIGVIHSPFKDRADAPRQPAAARGTEGTIELYEGHGFEDALIDLSRFDHVWVLFWFHLNGTWKPKVLPPRSTERRGVFATRSPYRPNPIGMSVVRLDRIEGLTLHVRDVDMLDDTPVLDLKPYLPYTDAIVRANHGWLEDTGEALPVRGSAEGETSGNDELDRPVDPPGAFAVQFTARAEEALAFLLERGVDLRAAVTGALALGPSPHAYRRIKREADGNGYRLAVREWRAHFDVEGRVVTVSRIFTGYRPSELYGEGAGTALDVHKAFTERFGLEGKSSEP
jgi:tRNA-Thr(GGU) m(6)t(6)A37 methyltransferase TsaA